MISLVTFASDDMSISAQRCVESAKRQGADCAYRMAPAELSTERGYGYWRWKPQAILAAMEGNDFQKRLSDGDILIYSDAGVEFIEPVQTVIDRMDQDIYLFGNQTEHAHWCKADILMDVMPSTFHALALKTATSPWEFFGKQAQASVIFFRVNDYTRAFVKEWLDWCLFEGGRLIDDSPSRVPNHPEFKENRHDQAILTTLAYREGIKLHEWYVRYESYTPGHLDCYPKEFERPLFLHHRKRNHEWENAA